MSAGIKLVTSDLPLRYIHVRSPVAQFALVQPRARIAWWYSFRRNFGDTIHKLEMQSSDRGRQSHGIAVICSMR